MKKIIRYLLRDQVDFIFWILCIAAFIVHLCTGMDLTNGFILVALWGFRSMLWNGKTIDKNETLFRSLKEYYKTIVSMKHKENLFKTFLKDNNLEEKYAEFESTFITIEEIFGEDK